MANEGKHNLDRVLASLSKRVKFTGKVIDVKNGSVGIKILGKLDFLQNYHGYIVRFA